MPLSVPQSFVLGGPWQAAIRTTVPFHGARMNPLVIIHGWSDDSSSFDELRRVISTQGGVDPLVIRLGDWISMNDEVTLCDVAEAFQRAWLKHQLPSTPRSVDLVVHSTGALVVREWMTRFHKPQSVPIHRLLMLAPANFGSPLAHKGHSFIGRAVKGWGEPGFQTGKLVLKALELASPYTFDLAHKDLFNQSTPWYGPGGILCTVLVGDTGYKGIASIANENGSDGTVRISTANLKAAKLTLHLGEKNQVLIYRFQQSDGEVAFGIVPGEDHSTIALKGKRKKTLTVDLILGALKVGDADWSRWVSSVTSQTVDGGRSDQYQNTVIRLRDHLGQEVTDYFVEFYRTDDPKDWSFEQRLYKRFIESVHPYKDNQSYRSMYLDIRAMQGIKVDLQALNNAPLFMSFLAMPRFEPSSSPTTISLHPAGYRPVGENDTGGLEINLGDLDEVFAAHRTLLVEAQVHRAVDDNVFRLWPT